jgi:hypothetical protein
VEGTRRIAQSISADWDALMQAHESRVAGYDAMHVDPVRQTATWTRAGTVVLEAPVELIGVFFPDLGLFRWWWSGKEHAIHLAPARLDEAFGHAQRTDMRPLLTRQHQLDGEDDAAMLCRVAAYFAHATAMVQTSEEERVSFFAVFAATARAPAGMGREVARTLPPPPVREAVNQSEGLQQAPSVAAPTPIREPARSLVLPVVHVANTMIRRAFRVRARSALLVVNVDTSRDKARFYVTLVAATDDGDLSALDTSRELLDAAGIMLVEDARSGNGRWGKLVVRIDCEGEGAAIRSCEVTV